MSKEKNCSAASRYRTVRKNLDALGYKQALSLDSLPLIELLLVDLAQTKETLKHFQSIAKDNLEACSQLQLAVDPYKCDNARLVQECNQTHLELIEAKELSQKQCNEYKKSVRKLESELADLQLSFSKNLQRIKQLETESSNKSKKILELQGKCCKPIVNNVNLGTKKRACYPLRRPILESETCPRTTSTSSITFSKKSIEPYVVDFVSMADHRIGSLNNEVKKLKEELFLNNEYIETLKSQLNTKEKELLRLRKMLEGGRPCTSLNKDHCCLLVENMNGLQPNLENSEITSLQQAKMNVEQQLKECLNKQHDAMTQAMKLAERNEELENELKSIDRAALAVEADCNSTVKENNRRVCRLQEKLGDVMTQVHVLENELTVQRREAQELRADLEACRLEKCSVQRVLDSTLEEKKLMTDRINNLTMMASKSPDKSDSCHEKKSTACSSIGFTKECSHIQKPHDKISQCHSDKLIREKNVIIESLQNTIERLENDRDHYKCEYLKIKDHCKHDIEKDNDGLWSQLCELQAQMSEKEHAISKLLREKRELCQEKFNLENKVQDYKRELKSSNSPCNVCHSSASLLSERNSISTSKIDRLERERDNARCDVERLIEERDALRERLKESRRTTITGLDDQVEDLREELQRTRQDLTEQRTQYYQLRTLQDQTDQALSDVQAQLTECENEMSNALDRNKTMERQQLQLDNQIKELRQEIGTHRSKMSQMDREKDQLLMDLDEKTEKIAALEREIIYKEQQACNMEQQIRDLTHTKTVCVDQAADVNRQLRSMQLEMENMQRQLSSASIERESAIQENRRLQDDLAAVSCEVRNLLKDLEVSKAESQDLKRQLQTYVTEVRRAEDLLCKKESERTEMLNHFRSLSLEASVLENNNHSLESEAAEARGALQSARDQILDCERQLSDKDCLIRGYESQITDLTQNVASLEIQLQQAIDQQMRTEDELRTVRDLCVTLEQQKETISQRQNEADNVRADYEARLATYKNEQEIFLSQMNKDHVQMDRLEKLLEDARKETMSCQTNSRELQNEVSRLKQKVGDLQNKVSTETTEVRKYQTQAAEYSKQITDLRRQVTNERFERARLQEDNRRQHKRVDQRCQEAYKVKFSEDICDSDYDERENESCSACVSSSGQLSDYSREIHRIRRFLDLSTSYNASQQSCYATKTEDPVPGKTQKCRTRARAAKLAAKANSKSDSECEGPLEKNDMGQRSKPVAPATFTYPPEAPVTVTFESSCSEVESKCSETVKKCQSWMSTCWIGDTLAMLQKLIEERQQSGVLEVVFDATECDPTIQVIKEKETQHSTTCTNCEASTQTIDSGILHVPEIHVPRLPELLRILAEFNYCVGKMEAGILQMRLSERTNQRSNSCESTVKNIVCPRQSVRTQCCPKAMHQATQIVNAISDKLRCREAATETSPVLKKPCTVATSPEIPCCKTRCTSPVLWKGLCDAAISPEILSCKTRSTSPVHQGCKTRFTSIENLASSTSVVSNWTQTTAPLCDVLPSPILSRNCVEKCVCTMDSCILRPIRCSPEISKIPVYPNSSLIKKQESRNRPDPKRTSDPSRQRLSEIKLPDLDETEYMQLPTPQVNNLRKRSNIESEDQRLNSKVSAGSTTSENEKKSMSDAVDSSELNTGTLRTDSPVLHFIEVPDELVQEKLTVTTLPNDTSES